MDQVEKILSRLELTVAKVYRDGPRYWVGKVTTPTGKAQLLKVVIDNTAWANPLTGETFRPSDQLRTEIMLFDALGRHRAEQGLSPAQIIVESAPDSAWVLRRYYDGRDMAAGKSPFVFHEDFFEPKIYKLVLDYITDYQELTPKLRAKLEKAPLADQHALQFKMVAVDLDNPSGWLAPYAAAIRDYLAPLHSFHDKHLNTLAHGQVYPPHIYLDGHQVNMIDWENVMLNNSMQDFVSLWIRGYGRPDWQAEFIHGLSLRGLLAGKVEQQMWDLEVLLQSSGNLNYLFWSKLEDEATKTVAAASLKLNIERILAA